MHKDSAMRKMNGAVTRCASLDRWELTKLFSEITKMREPQQGDPNISR